MDLDRLNQSINDNLYTMMSIKEPVELKNRSKDILKLLSDNRDLLEDNSNENLYIYMFITIAVAVFVFSVTDKLVPLFSMLIFVGILFLIYIIIKITSVILEHNIDGSVLLVDELSKKGWSFSTFDSVDKWKQWQLMYPFINKGDVNDSIALRIYGIYRGYSFCYFEYDHTIEIEDQIMHEDSDGETYYETEYDYEDYTESGIIIGVNSNLPYIETSFTSKYTNPLKFSYIDLNERMSAYSTKPHEAISFFNPIMQRNFAEFYSKFPRSSISIDKNDVFINFGVNLMNLPRTVRVDENLYSYIKRSNVSGNIEYIVQSLLPIIKGIN